MIILLNSLVQWSGTTGENAKIGFGMALSFVILLKPFDTLEGIWYVSKACHLGAESHYDLAKETIVVTKVCESVLSLFWIDHRLHSLL